MAIQFVFTPPPLCPLPSAYKPQPPPPPTAKCLPTPTPTSRVSHYKKSSFCLNISTNQKRTKSLVVTHTLFHFQKSIYILLAHSSKNICAWTLLLTKKASHTYLQPLAPPCQAKSKTQLRVIFPTEAHFRFHSAVKIDLCLGRNYLYLYTRENHATQYLNINIHVLHKLLMVPPNF